MAALRHRINVSLLPIGHGDRWMALLTFIRANEESATKARRLKET